MKFTPRPTRAAVLALKSVATAGLTLILAWWVPCAPAIAHTELWSSTPRQGETLTSLPTNVTLNFIDPVSLPDSGIMLRSSGQPRAKVLHGIATGAKVVIPLNGAATDSLHVLTWSVIGTDGHVVSGELTFTVGRPPLDAGMPATADRGASNRWFRFDVTARWLWALFVLATVGVVVFEVRCGSPVGLSMGPALRMLRLLTPATVAAAMVVAAVQLSADDRAAPSSIAPGAQVCAPIITAVVLAVAHAALVRSQGRLAQFVALVSLVPWAYTGHTGGDPVAIIGKLVHLLAGAVWFGGAFAIVVHLRVSRRVPSSWGQLREAATRFGRVAVFAAAVVSVSGAVLAWPLLGDPGRLLGSSYGRLLLFKATLVCVVLALGSQVRRHVRSFGSRVDVGSSTTRQALMKELSVFAVVVFTALILGWSSPSM